MGTIIYIYFLIPTFIFFLIVVYIIIDTIVVKNNLIHNNIYTIIPNKCTAYIKQTKENRRVGSILIKIYITDSNNKNYNYYFLNGSKTKFKNYINIINQGTNIKINVFQKTNIISSVLVDGELLEDLYHEVKYSEKIKKPMIYNHLYFKRTKKAMYKYEEFDMLDVQIVFENSPLYEELYIINSDNKYVKISYNHENHCEFYFEKTKLNSFLELKEELEKNNFIIDNKLRVIYTLENSDPKSFLMLINEFK